VKPFWTGVADIHRSPEMIREDRVLLRAQSTEETTAAAEGAVAELARLAPDTSGFIRFGRASAAKVTADLEQQVLSPQTVANMASRFAPATPDSGIAA